MAIKIVFGSMKGGVAKTTVSRSIAILLREQNQRVLLIDLDPSASLTDSLKDGFLSNELQEDDLMAYQAMQQKDLRKGIHPVFQNLDILPASHHLQQFPNLLASERTDSFIHDLIREIESDYDFIILDVAPILNDLHVNAVVAADYVIPIFDTKDLLRQNTSYLNFLKEIQATQDSVPQVLGIIASLIRLRNQTETEVLDAASTDVKDLLFETVILDRERGGDNPNTIYRPLLKEMLTRLQ